MFPPIFVVDHRIGPGGPPVDDDRHHDRPHVRRSQPQVLVIIDTRHDALSSPASGVIPDVPEAQRRRALLIDLAADPRFASNAKVAQRAGLRLRIGQALMRLGWWLVRPKGTQNTAG